MGNLIAPLSPINKSLRQKLKRKIMKLKNIMNEKNLTHIYRIYRPIAKEYSLFIATHGPFPKTDYIVTLKVSLNRCKTIEITPCIFLDPWINSELQIQRKYQKAYTLI